MRKSRHHLSKYSILQQAEQLQSHTNLFSKGVKFTTATFSTCINYRLMHTETLVIYDSSQSHTKITQLFVLTSQCLAGEARFPPVWILNLHCALIVF